MSGNEIKHRPPWGKMLALALTGAAVVLLGLVRDSAPVAFIGAVLLGSAPIGLVLPALRVARARRLDPRPWTGYSDQNDLLGAMHLLGFKSEDFDRPRNTETLPANLPEDDTS
jgi:hypothetical protein